jgi:hypothetical protein
MSLKEITNPLSISPLLSLVPVCGAMSNLKNYQASFFSRLENINLNKSVLKEEKEESAMLTLVLDWINSSQLESE